MTNTQGTTLAILFAPNRRTDVENDLAIANSIGSSLTGTFHPRPNSAVSVFPTIIDCVRSAIAAVKWYTQSEGGLGGIGIGIDDEGNTENALLLAERNLTNDSHNIFLTQNVFWQAKHLSGVNFLKIIETVLPGQKESTWIYSMTTNEGNFSDIVDAAASDDTAGWDAEPETPPGGSLADIDETVVAFDDDIFPGEAKANDFDISQPKDLKIQSSDGSSIYSDELPKVLNGIDNDEATIVHTQPGSSSVDVGEFGVTPEKKPDNGDATLINMPQPQGRTAVGQGETATLQNALKLIEQSEEKAQEYNRRGQHYWAIYEFDLVLTNDAVKNLEGLEGPIEKLQALRGECLADKGVSRGLRISGAGECLSIHRGPSLMIGRDPGNKTAGMKLRCQTLSRIPKQLRIDYHNKGYSITDLGSANGSFLDETQLVPNQAVLLERLQQGMTISLGGVLDPPAKGECRVHLSTLGENDDALIMQMQTSHMTENMRAQLASKWPDMESDCAGRWLYTETPILIGGGPNCGLHLATADNNDALARIEWGEIGYTLAPMSDQVKLDGAPILRPVVILDGAKLSVLEQEFYIEDNGG